MKFQLMLAPMEGITDAVSGRLRTRTAPTSPSPKLRACRILPGGRRRACEDRNIRCHAHAGAALQAPGFPSMKSSSPNTGRQRGSAAST